MNERRHQAVMVSLFFCVFLFVSFLHTPRGHYYTNYSLDQVEEVAKLNKEIVLYFARSDCPSCQKMDALLKERSGTLWKEVYRIDTQKEKNQSKLRSYLTSLKIEKVPTFVKKKQKSKSILSKSEVNLIIHEQKSKTIQKLNM